MVSHNGVAEADNSRTLISTLCAKEMPARTLPRLAEALHQGA
jgi:hypothetical protein